MKYFAVISLLETKFTAQALGASPVLEDRGWFYEKQILHKATLAQPEE